MKRFFLTMLAAMAAAPALAVTSTPSDTALAQIRDALNRGYGQTCSLEMQPVDQNGYYPCIDVGPYRFVVQYGHTSAFVLIQGQAPFRILDGTDSGANFEYQGPWVNDLPAQVAQWYDDEVLGARAAAQADASQAAREQAAGDAVTAYLKSLEPSSSSEPMPNPQPASPAPQVIYILPPNYPAQSATPTPLQGGPAVTQDGIPSLPGLPGEGVLVAPGVVSYPPSQ